MQKTIQDGIKSGFLICQKLQTKYIKKKKGKKEPSMQIEKTYTAGDIAIVLQAYL